MSDYILLINVKETGLAAEKRPPICDGCNNTIPRLDTHCQECGTDYSSRDRSKHIGTVDVDGETMNVIHASVPIGPSYNCNALILDQGKEGRWFHSIQCDDCVKKYFPKLRKMKEDSVAKKVRMTVYAELSHPSVVTAWDPRPY
jgi:hypothetical protein